MSNRLTSAALEKFGYDEQKLTELLDLKTAEEQYRAYLERLAATYNNPELRMYDPIFSHIQRGGSANE